MGGRFQLLPLAICMQLMYLPVKCRISPCMFAPTRTISLGLPKVTCFSFNKVPILAQSQAGILSAPIQFMSSHQTHSLLPILSRLTGGCLLLKTAPPSSVFNLSTSMMRQTIRIMKGRFPCGAALHIFYAALCLYFIESWFRMASELDFARGTL